LQRKPRPCVTNTKNGGPWSQKKGEKREQVPGGDRTKKGKNSVEWGRKEERRHAKGSVGKGGGKKFGWDKSKKHETLKRERSAPGNRKKKKKSKAKLRRPRPPGNRKSAEGTGETNHPPWSREGGEHRRPREQGFMEGGEWGPREKMNRGL